MKKQKTNKKLIYKLFESRVKKWNLALKMCHADNEKKEKEKQLKK